MFMKFFLLPQSGIEYKLTARQ